MSLLPKIKYGEIEKTRAIDETRSITEVTKMHDGAPVAFRTVLTERHFVPFGDATKAGKVLTDLYSDNTRLAPDAKIERLKSHKDGFFIITQYTVLE